MTVKPLIIPAVAFIAALALAGCGAAEPPAPAPAALPAPVVELNGAPVTAQPGAAPAALPTLVLPTATLEPPTPAPTPTPEPSVTPVASATPVASPTPLGPQAINGIPLDAIAPWPPEVAANVRAIAARGRELGRDPRAFSKLGDSTVLNPHFLGPFDQGAYNLGDFGHLQATIDRYAGSFERHGVAARFGQHSWTVFDPMWADKEWCEPNEDSLACEFRLQNPSVLFVRLGSNDAGAPSGFRYNLAQVIETAMAGGVIPIIGTKADRFEGSNENNDILRALAAEYAVPLWDFDRLAETLPGRGLGDDAVHLKIEDLPHDYSDAAAFERGHAMQDLSALIVLDRVRREIEE
jgi:hypothetical protein